MKKKQLEKIKKNREKKENYKNRKILIKNLEYLKNATD